MPSIPRLLRPPMGWLFGVLILLTSLFGNYIITLFTGIIFLGKHNLWRHLMDQAISFWMTIPMGFLECFFGMKVRVTGDEIEIDEPGLIIMNHRTRLDWMYIWSALYQMNPWLITTNKISLKAQLKKLPGAGFGMSAAQFIFLERKMEVDKESFDNSIEYYKGMNKNYQLLFFPEGTDKSPWTTTKSTEYAKKNGLIQLQYLLYPRVTGFYHLITKMRQAEYISYIYDVTIGYPYNIVQSELELVLKGASPKEVHYHIRKIPISEVPKSEVEVGKWLNQIWIEKEERLKQFYAEPRSCDRRFPMEKGQRTWKNSTESGLQYMVKVCSLIFWISVIAICSYHIFFVRLFQIGVIYFIIVSNLISCIYGSIDKLVYYKWKTSTKTVVA